MKELLPRACRAPGLSVCRLVEPSHSLVDEVWPSVTWKFQERRCHGQVRQFHGTVAPSSSSHGLAQMRTPSAIEVAWLDHGRLKEVGPAPGVIASTPISPTRRQEGQGRHRHPLRQRCWPRSAASSCWTTQAGPVNSLRTGDEATIPPSLPLRRRLRSRLRLLHRHPGGIFAWGLHGLDDGFQPERGSSEAGAVDVFPLTRHDARPGPTSSPAPSSWRLSSVIDLTRKAYSIVQAAHGVRGRVRSVAGIDDLQKVKPGEAPTLGTSGWHLEAELRAVSVGMNGREDEAYFTAI